MLTITQNNISTLVADLRADLGIELFSKKAELLSELEELAIEALEDRDNASDKDQTIERLQDTIDEISRMASY